jgi:adenine phosphoribosyltransferase
MDLRSRIRDVPDFPKPGILFKDITPLLGDPTSLAEAVALVTAPHRADGITKVVGIESRGFILAAPVALALGAGFVPVRKPGKLPWKARKRAYGLEYGSDALELHEDAVGPGDRVLVVDDVLATGGTLGAAVALVREAGATAVAAAVLIELAFLGGRARLDLPVSAGIVYA